MVFFPLVTIAQTTVKGLVSNRTVDGIHGAKVSIDNNVNYRTHLIWMGISH